MRWDDQQPAPYESTPGWRWAGVIAMTASAGMAVVLIVVAVNILRGHL